MIRSELLCAAALFATLSAAPGQVAMASPSPVIPADFVALRDVDPSIVQDMRYATPHNFTGAPVAGYRPQRAVDEFVSWAADLADQQMKPEFYPRVDKSMLFADGYIAQRSGHSRGSTLDVTLAALPPVATPPYIAGQPLVDCAAPQAIRFPDDSIDMGTGYDCFDTLAHTADPRITGDQAKNRLLLGEALERPGFANYPMEWWHFTYKPADQGEPYPDTYFDFPVADPPA